MLELKCPCCCSLFYNDFQSIEEAILVGEAVTITTHIRPLLLQSRSAETSAQDIKCVNEINKFAIKNLEAALMLTPNNFTSLYLLFRICCAGYTFLKNHDQTASSLEFYFSILYNTSFKLLDNHTVADYYVFVKSECYDQLTSIFYEYHNYPAALKYSKLAYEHCLRSNNYAEANDFKALYLKSRADFAKLPPLRFAVGSEVEFRHEFETGSEWKLGKVVELYYRELRFDVSFSAPYRPQLLDDSADLSPVYAWVKADTDRYVRKVGVRSIEDTRYQARLDAKVEELAQIYCSKEFVEDIYDTLAQDREFVEMLQSVRQVELSESMLSLYRLLVMYRQPLVRTDSGYHVLSSDEVIAGIRAFFDPAHLSSDAASEAVGYDTSSGYAEEIRAYTMTSLQGSLSSSTRLIGDPNNIENLLFSSIRAYVCLMSLPHESTAEPSDGADTADPSEIYDAISNASTTRDLANMLVKASSSTKLECLLMTWICVHTCLEHPDAGPAWECPFVYFFIKYCLDQGTGVPKLALAVYDRMNMQLSREFIRCANPSCELNRLDKSTGQVKFKKCSRCQAVIYCSRECQTAHYPEHKRLCRKHSTG